MQAINATESSAFSGTVSATTPGTAPPAPNAPTGLAATTPSSTQVSLSWVDNATNETGYVLERASSSAFTGATAIALPAGATSYADTGRTAATTYWYRVRAMNGTTPSTWSAAISATTPAAPVPAPAAPTGLAATTPSTTQVSLSWVDNATNETGYVLERAATNAFTGATAINLAAGATSYADTGRTAGTTYWYRVRAVNATGPSAWSTAISATTPTTPPPPPPPASYATEVAADAPVSHWRLGEASGTAAADARAANPGVYRGAPTLNTVSLLSADTLNKAVRFDAVDDWVEVADSASLDLTTAMTIEAWIKPEVVPGRRRLGLRGHEGRVLLHPVQRPAARVHADAERRPAAASRRPPARSSPAGRTTWSPPTTGSPSGCTSTARRSPRAPRPAPRP